MLKRANSEFECLAGDLHRLATNLEKDIADWQTIDVSSREAETERTRRGHILWGLAQRAGVVLFELCGLGAFDALPRIKNHICPVRSELKKGMDSFQVKPFYSLCKAPYYPPTNDHNYDVFFVNIFEGFCRLWARSFEDHRLFDRYSDLLERAKLYVRILKEASEALLPKSPASRAALIGEIISLGERPKRNVEVRVTRDQLFSQISDPPDEIKGADVTGIHVCEDLAGGKRLIRLHLDTTSRGRVLFYIARTQLDIGLLLDDLEASLGAIPSTWETSPRAST